MLCTFICNTCYVDEGPDSGDIVKRTFCARLVFFRLSCQFSARLKTFSPTILCRVVFRTQCLHTSTRGEPSPRREVRRKKKTTTAERSRRECNCNDDIVSIFEYNVSYSHSLCRTLTTTWLAARRCSRAETTSTRRIEALCNNFICPCCSVIWFHREARRCPATMLLRRSQATPATAYGGRRVQRDGFDVVAGVP